MSDPIAQVESFHLAIPSVYGGPPPRGTPQWPLIELVLVRVETKGGFVGWGEAFGHRISATTHAAMESLVAPLCIGLDGTSIEGTAATLGRALYMYGLDGPISFALSGINIALWDIAGQRSGRPVAQLLAPGTVTRSVDAYASLLRYGDADLVAEAAADAVRRGHRAVKLHEATLEATAAARSAIGKQIDLTLDVNCRWSVDEAIATAKRLGPLALDWLEEPCWPNDAESLARVAAASSVPVAAGENAGTLAELGRIASIGRATVIQPSAAKIGGISGLVAAQSLAARLGAKVATHSAYFGPALAATVQFCAAFGLDCEWYDCRLETSPSDFVPEDGRFVLTEAAGLGVRIDPDLIKTYRVAP